MRRAGVGAQVLLAVSQFALTLSILSALATSVP